MAYILICLLTGVYAALLNTAKGRLFATRHTAESVVIGTALTLAGLRLLLPLRYWLRVVLAFVAAGGPMVARSLVNRSLKTVLVRRSAG